MPALRHKRCQKASPYIRSHPPPRERRGDRLRSSRNAPPPLEGKTRPEGLSRAERPEADRKDMDRLQRVPDPRVTEPISLRSTVGVYRVQLVGLRREAAMGRDRRRRLMPVWVGLSAAMLVLAGCSNGGTGSDGGSLDSVAKGSAATQKLPHLHMSPAPRSEIPWTAHPEFVALHATLTNVRLTSGPDVVAGTLRAGNTRWRANSSLTPSTRYQAVVGLQGTDGTVVTRQVGFKTATAAQQITATASL